MVSEDPLRGDQVGGSVEAQVKGDGDLIGDARNLEGRHGLRKGNGSYSQPQCSETASVNINHVSILVFFFLSVFLFYIQRYVQLVLHIHGFHMCGFD